MAARIDTGVLRDMKTYGAFDISACFNCGNCTAVCPLSQDSVAFPRRMIRYAQLGQKTNVIASRELWLCYYCAECSDTCPRQAEPGEFMASARRFAIAGFDPTTIARRLYTSAAFTWGLLAAVFAALIVILLGLVAGLAGGRADSDALLTFVPYETIHWLGIAVGVIAVVVTRRDRRQHALVDLPGTGARRARPAGDQGRGVPAQAGAPRAGHGDREVFGQARYRDCDTEKTSRAGAAAGAALARPLRHHDRHDRARLATVLDYFFKTPGRTWRSGLPTRLLGTVAGALLVYGTTVAIVQRLRKTDKYTSHSLLSDWLFLAFLWAIGLTGFILEVAEYAHAEQLGRRRLPRAHRAGHGADPAPAVHQARAHRLPAAGHLVHGVPAPAGDQRLTHSRRRSSWQTQSTRSSSWRRTAPRTESAPPFRS